MSSKAPSGPSLLKRRKRFEKCILTFPDRADFYEEQIRLIDADLLRMKACIMCGRPLKGEDSQARGFGPECMKKLAAQDKEVTDS